MRLQSISAFFRRQILSPLLVLYLAAVYFLIVFTFRPEIASFRNLSAIAIAAAPLIALAIGQTFVVITGGIDLSVTAVVSLASVAGASIMSGAPEGDVVGRISIAVVAVCLVGLLVGTAHGISVALLRMPAFLVTLVSLMFLEALAELLTRSRPIGDLPDGFVDMGYSDWLFVPSSVWLVGLAAVLAHGVLSSTVLGKRLYAVGQNYRTARAAGIPTRVTLIAAYAISGLMAGLAALLYSMRLETGKADLVSTSVLLDCIAAVVIGGASLMGGSGTILGTVLGALLLTLVSNSLNLFGNLQVWHVLLIKGGIVLLAAGLESVRNEIALREGTAA